MSTTAAPIVPPRPARSQQPPSIAGSKLPEIPPRPATKRLDRSTSPGSFPRSPFYDLPSESNLARSLSNEPSNLNLPARPPSVSLPTIGQEGNEYADLDYGHAYPPASQGPEDAAQTRNIGELKLHAPKPSLPKSSAKAQVQAVTRTDSQTVAALGLGKTDTPVQDDHPDPVPRILNSRSSFSRPGSQASGERRPSIMYGEDDQGPASLGMRVPINPYAGDVQAPSPSPFPSSQNSGAPGLNGTQSKRHHSRTKSGREVYLPPGSYGLHGHGVIAQDKFEKDWYAKHPEQLIHEEGHGHGHYASTGSGRGEWALSSEDLNKIVRDTASRGNGFGTTPSIMGFPDEQIGYLASEQYATRSQLTSPNYLNKMQSNSSQPAVESPLRKASFPGDVMVRDELSGFKSSISSKSDNALSENEDEIIHVDDPKRHYSKITGGEGTMGESEDLNQYPGKYTEEDRLVEEHDYNAPILASDEVAKEVGGEHLQPAISPKVDRRGSAYLGFDENGSGDLTPSSRPMSRSGSIHGVNPTLARFASRHDERDDLHTPLADVEEYEPLFPDDADGSKKVVTAADRFKQRPDTLKHRFPSQDIWEDTPDSALHQATVSTPDLPKEAEEPTEANASNTFETPEQESARKGKATEEEKRELMPKEERLAKSRFAPHLRDDMPSRPGAPQRFPSQDIWEDSPDSMQLVTTVYSPPPPEENITSPSEAAPSKPMVPPRPAKSKLSETSTASPQAQVQPSLPARPPKRLHAVPPADAQLTEPTGLTDQLSEKAVFPPEPKKVPLVSDRSKPQVPPRPGKKNSMEGLVKTTSATSAGSDGSNETEKGVPLSSPPAVKPKPVVPARTIGGSKIANLKGSFMSDLNQRLQLGPPKEKEREPEPETGKEAVPLADARKGRARGPQRRAPAKSDTAEVAVVEGPKHVRFAVSVPKVLWDIDDSEGVLNVPGSEVGGEVSTSVSTILTKDDEVESTATTAMPGAWDDVAELKPPAQEQSESEESRKPTALSLATEQPQAEDPPKSMAPSLARNTAGESVDPGTTLTPQSAKGSVDRLKGLGTLSQQTTASSSGYSGAPLEQLETQRISEPMSISHYDTASSTATGASLERLVTKDPVRAENLEQPPNELMTSAPKSETQSSTEPEELGREQ